MKLKVEVMDKMDEEVLVVSKDIFFARFEYFEGFKPARHFYDKSEYTNDLEGYEYTMYSDHILSNKRYMKRRDCEEDPSYLQIIPYICIFHENGIFYVERGSGSGESRLHGKISIGMGGHLNESDWDWTWPVYNPLLKKTSTVTHGCRNDLILHGAMRELYEETDIDGNINITFAGLINYDSDPVNAVHLGIVFFAKLWEGSTIEPRELDKISKHGTTYPHILTDSKHVNKLELWSKSILEELKKIDKEENYA